MISELKSVDVKILTYFLSIYTGTICAMYALHAGGRNLEGGQNRLTVFIVSNMKHPLYDITVNFNYISSVL